MQPQTPDYLRPVSDSKYKALPMINGDYFHLWFLHLLKPILKIPIYNEKSAKILWDCDSRMVCGRVSTIKKILFDISIIHLPLGWYHLAQDIAIY